MTVGTPRAPWLVAVDFDPFSGDALAAATATTEAQREVWTASRFSDDANLAFNESISLRLTGEVDVEALRTALDGLARRHEALRTTFSSDGTTLCVAAAGVVGLSVVDSLGPR